MKLARTHLLAALLGLALAAGSVAGETKPARAADRPGERATAMIDRIREALSQVNLTPEQKTKVDAIVSTLKSDLQTLRERVQAGELNRDEALEEGRSLVADARKQVHDLLTEEQRQQLRSKVAEEMPGQRALERLGELAQQLDLSDDQKAQLKALREELRGKLRDLLKDAQGNRDGVREKARELFRQYMEKARALLTDEQRQKARELMQRPQGEPATQPRPTL